MNVLAAFALSLACILPGDGVAMLVVDDYGTTRWRKSHFEAFQLLNVEQRLRKAKSYPYSFWSDHTYSKYESGETLNGFVATVTPSGAVVRNSFSTLPSKDVFELVLSDQTSRLQSGMPEGITPEVRRTGDITTIANPEYRAQSEGLPPGARVLKWEVNYRFSDPVLVIGKGPGTRKSVKTVPMDAVKRALRRAKGHNWFLLYRPHEVPASSRAALLKTVITAAAPNMQQRDNEADHDHVGRLAASKARIALLQQLLNDVDEIVAGTSWPTETRPTFRGHVTLEARQRSKLAGLIRALQVKRGLQMKPGNAGGFSAAVSVPDLLKPVLKEWVRETDLKFEGLLAALENGEIKLSGAFDVDDEGRASVHGVSSVSPTESDERHLGAINLSPRPEGVPFQPLAWRLSAKEFGCAFRLAGSKPPAPTTDEVIEERNPPLLELKGDFAPVQFADRSSDLRTLFHDLETVYVRKRGLSALGGWPGETQKRTETVHGLGKEGGNWTYSLKLEVVGDSLKLSWTVGEDLHALFRYRTLSF